MHIEYSARCHIGNVRDNNEDNLFVDGIYLPHNFGEREFKIDGHSSTPSIFAVCDGMGGEEHGEKASLLAVETLFYESSRLKAASQSRLDKEIQSYAGNADGAIRFNLGWDGTRAGTTLVLAIAAKGAIRCWNIGDSRIYCLHSNACRQITNDHTLAAERIRDGATPQEAWADKDAAKLTRCLGIGDDIEVEGYPPISGDCRVLLCSDGLTDMVADADIERLMRYSASAADTADALMRYALAGGGRDNVTVIVLDVKGSKTGFFRRLARKN